VNATNWSGSASLFTFPRHIPKNHFRALSVIYITDNILSKLIIRTWASLSRELRETQRPWPQRSVFYIQGLSLLSGRLRKVTGGRAMKDYQTHLEKLRADAAECALIRDLAMDPEKRELFDRLSVHLISLAAQVEQAMLQRKVRDGS